MRLTRDDHTLSTAKVDLHLHSYASNVTDYYAANAFSIPESYSAPRDLYRLLKQRGMSLVTITDHNSIDGVLELLNAGHRDVFISAEMTATFPEDRCNIHLTVANVTEMQFREIDRLRGNVYEMVAYLDQEIAAEASNTARNRIAYFMTHPLMSTQNRPYGREGALTVAHIEKALLLCNCIEVHNGARTPALNALTDQMLDTLNPTLISRFANQHGIEPKGPTPWLKARVGGSDDHSGLNPGLTWTEFPVGTTLDVDSLIDSIRARTTRPTGAHGGPLTIAHSLIKLLYDGGKRPRQNGGASTEMLGGPISSLLQLVFDVDSRTLAQRGLFLAQAWRVRAQAITARWRSRRARTVGNSPAFEVVLEREIFTLIAEPAFVAQLNATPLADERIFLVVKTLVNRVFAQYVARLRSAGSLGLVATIKEVVALFSSNVFVSLPYLLSFMQQSADGLIARDVRTAFGIANRRKIALVTDTYFEINGVSASIKRMIGEAVKRQIDFTVVACVSAEELEIRIRDPEVRKLIDTGRLKLFTSITSLEFPEYDGLQIHFPPLLDLLKYIQESGFSKIHISTPGTMGLLGLAAAKLLQIESAATYHTSIPEYVENYTKDVSLEAIAWKYMILFYHSVDEVLVPSKYVGRLLHERGLRNRKILVLDRWVDIERFQPARRTPGFWRRFDLTDEAALVKFIYVGRVAIEKNLHVLATAYRRLRATRSDAHLIIIGDGPFRAELAAQLQGLPVTYTGYLVGDTLARAIASADVKVFPSTTDTWGNAPLEAQASGLPVIVSDIGGPAELMLDGVTGFKVPGHQADALQDAMLALMDGALRAAMGQNARDYSVANRVDEPFTAVLDSETLRQRVRLAKQASKHRAAYSKINPPITDPAAARASRPLTLVVNKG